MKCAVAMSTSATTDDQIKKFVAHRNFLSVVIVRLHVRPVRPPVEPSGCPTMINTARHLGRPRAPSPVHFWHRYLPERAGRKRHRQTEPSRAGGKRRLPTSAGIQRLPSPAPFVAQSPRLWCRLRPGRRRSAVSTRAAKYSWPGDRLVNAARPACGRPRAWKRP